MATPKKLEQPARLSRPQGPGGIRRASHEEAIDALLVDAEASGEGTRIVGLAATRKGKTGFARKLVRAMLERGIAERAIVHDTKYPSRAQYAGREVWSQHELALSVADNSVTVVRYADPAGAEDCAALAEAAVGDGIKTLVVLDEGAFSLARNDQGEPIERRWAGPSLGWLQLQGGGPGASSLSLWQMLRQAPGGAIDSASGYFIGCLGGRSLAYALDYRIIPAEAVPTITTLAPGEVCIFAADREWDRTIYLSPPEP